MTKYGPDHYENDFSLQELACDNNVVVFGVVETLKQLYAVPKYSEVYLEYYQNPGVFSVWDSPKRQVQMALVPGARIKNPDAIITPQEIDREISRLDTEKEGADDVGVAANILICDALISRLLSGLSQGPAEGY